LETFENDPSTWKVSRDLSGSGSVLRSTSLAAEGAASALLSTSSANSSAQVRVSFSDPASQHLWNERPGTFFWQDASLYLPSATLAQLGPSDFLTLAGLWSSSDGAGWFLRVHSNGQLFVQGTRSDTNTPVEFNVYASLPRDRWVNLELGLHSQNGPGVKRAFAFLLDGQFFGWYHQGRMTTETYDRAALGILSSSSAKPLSVYVDAWRVSTSAAFPSGPDTRSSASLQEKDYRSLSGAQWQIDWTTWANNLTLDPTHGLFSPTDRFQSGYNQDRMPDLSSGWAEIEIDWPSGTPPSAPSGYFGPMLGFRKGINREENLEVIPIGQGAGNVNLAFEAWAGGAPVIFQQWALPPASGGANHLPEPGDVIRARWEQVSPTDVHVTASYFDASANLWYTNILDSTLNLSSVSGVNFNDGYHRASSITADTPNYSIRRYKVGTLSTYPPAGQ
jgi:hypothetical protein